ncbi:MAG: type II toxin-antitoxin system VapC family toxin [Nitrospiria bacterium]
MDDEFAEASAPSLIFDTDVLIWYFRANEKARRFLTRVPYRRRAVSSLVMMELVQGCRHPGEVEDVEAFRFQNIARVLDPDSPICHRAITLLKRHAMADGLRVVDALIAATALEYGYALATANLKHYRSIAGLKVFPFKP